jgi:hypothetical protein
MAFKILRFSESSKRYPQKVNQKEFFNKKGIHKMVSFTQTERNTMFDILTEKQKWVLYPVMVKRKDIRWSTSSEFIEIYCGRNFFEIVKLDDDWFTIISEDSWSQNEYFICDEFEEVVNFLTDLV